MHLHYDISEHLEFTLVPRVWYLILSHINHPQVGLCEEMSMGKKKISDLNDTLEANIYGSCNVPQFFFRTTLKERY
jgi:hypothetical protein